MSLRALTKNTFILASPKFIAFFLKIIRAKINAILIGTTGVGIVNQLLEVNNKLGNFSTLSLNLGAKKLIIDNNTEENKNNIPSIVSLFTLLVFIFATLFYITGIIFYQELSEFFLGEQAKKYFFIVYILFPLIPLTTVPKAVLGALQEFKYIATLEIIITVAAFLTYIPLIYFFKTEGAVLNISITILVTFLIFYYFVFYKTAKKRGQRLLSFKNFRINKIHLKELTTISGIASVLGIYAIIVELAIRGIIASKLGMEKIGIYVPIIAWSGFFSTLFLPALFQYIFPKYGECKTNADLSDVANDAFRLLTFMITPFVLLMISLNKILIPMFYSKEFLGASVFLPAHFIGIYFLTWMRILKQMFIPAGWVKAFVPFAISEFTLCLLVVFFFVDQIGLWVWTLRYAFVPFIMFIGYIIFLTKKIQLRIKRGNLILMLYGVFSSFIIYWISLINYYSFVPALIFVFVLYIFLKKSEKIIMINILAKYLTSPFTKSKD